MNPFTMRLSLWDNKADGKNPSIHPSISFLWSQGSGIYPSCVRRKVGLPPRQVSSLSHLTWPHAWCLWNVECEGEEPGEPKEPGEPGEPIQTYWRTNSRQKDAPGLRIEPATFLLRGNSAKLAWLNMKKKRDSFFFRGNEQLLPCWGSL